MHQCLLALFGGKMTVDSDSHDLVVSSAGQVQVLFLEERKHFPLAHKKNGMLETG